MITLVPSWSLIDFLSCGSLAQTSEPTTRSMNIQLQLLFLFVRLLLEFLKWNSLNDRWCHTFLIIKLTVTHQELSNAEPHYWLFFVVLTQHTLCMCWMAGRILDTVTVNTVELLNNIKQCFHRCSFTFCPRSTALFSKHSRPDITLIYSNLS